jgi:Flp pilus assembly protein TadG
VIPVRILRETEGATAVEFAMVAPVLLLTLLGLFDFGYNMYTNALLQGAIQEAARDSTIEGATTGALDTQVKGVVFEIVPNAAMRFDRKAYADFSNVGRPEDFTDVNGDGACNDGEPFEDANENGAWDSDQGKAGQGGARDAVLYTVTVSYPRAFPVAGMIGLPQDVTTSATTVLRNQPYTLQTRRTRTGNCE